MTSPSPDQDQAGAKPGESAASHRPLLPTIITTSTPQPSATPPALTEDGPSLSPSSISHRRSGSFGGASWSGASTSDSHNALISPGSGSGSGAHEHASLLGTGSPTLLQVPPSPLTAGGSLSPYSPTPSLTLAGSPSTVHTSLPGSPALSVSSHMPPSPTLSAVSDSSAPHPFSTALKLRENDNRTPRQPSTHILDGRYVHGRNQSVATEATTKTLVSSADVTDEDGRPSAEEHAASRQTRVTAVSTDKFIGPQGAEGRVGKEEEKARGGRKRKWWKFWSRGQVQDDDDAHPDPLASLPTDPGPFDFTARQLGWLVDPKDVHALRDLGGVEGLLKGLHTDGKRGLNEFVKGGVHDDGHVRHSDHHDGPDLEAATATATAGDAGGGSGASGPSREDRTRVFGKNMLPERKSKTLLQLMWLALQDKVLVLLSIAAVVSLALGLYQDLGAPPKQYRDPDSPTGYVTEPKVDWVEGVAIIVAIVIVVLVGSLNDYQKERQFRNLNAKKEERDVKCVRGGRLALISVHDVLVGDVLQLEPGEIVPVDGVFLRGHNVKCDESGATGESDAIRKITYEDCLKTTDKAIADGGKHLHKDCFLISGSKVLEGVGEYVVTAIGPCSFNGKLMLSLRTDTDNTPLQTKLNHLAELIAKLGSLAGILLFTALMIRFFVQLGTDPHRTSQEKAQSFIQILIIAVTVVVVAVPEGLPLAVTLALAFATKRMTSQNLLVRVLGSCETMANATVVCTDKTGTLTQNEMSVVAGSIGVHLKFAYRLEENKTRSNANDDVGKDQAASPAPRRGRKDISMDQCDLGKAVRGELRTLLNDSIAINSTAFEDEVENSDGSTKVVFVGNKTETALLKLAKDLGWGDYRVAREQAEVVQMIPFSSERKAMGVVVKLPAGGYRFYLKGASEVLSKLCMYHVTAPKPTDGNNSHDDDVPLETTAFTDETRGNISRTIIFYANQSLRTIAICYRDLPSWPPPGAAEAQRKVANLSGRKGAVAADGDADPNEVPYEFLAKDLTMIAVMAIEDPLRDGVRDAVDACRRAGVQVKMCTGDNVLTARSIATQCGIYSSGGIILEGPVFRQLSDRDMMEVVPRLQVLARSSPEDKKILVSKLQEMGEVVGVTGDGTNDGPALKTANVGFSMGIAGTEVAKEASDIILMDDNFSSIVSAIMWGRCVNDSVKKFLQFQISVNIVAVIVTFVSAVASNSEESVLSAVQLLWLNLIMDTLAALALATDPASPASLDRKPDKRSAPLISVDMWKMIVGQSIFQTVVTFVLHFAGKDILNMHSVEQADQIADTSELNTIVFNTFVWCQIFNQINCRRLDRKYNIFEGISKNPWYILIFIIMVAVQILIIEVGGAAFQVRRLHGRGWGISIIIGLMSLPTGVLIRTIPTEPIERLLIRLHLFPDPDALPTVVPEREEEPNKYNDAIEQVRDNLAAFSRIRGGRMRASSIVRRSRIAQLRKAGVEPRSLMAMVPSLVVSSIGAGWQPQQPRESALHDPAAGDPSVSSAALWEGGKLQFHPETDKDDPLLSRYRSAAHGEGLGGGGGGASERGRGADYVVPAPKPSSPSA